MKRPEQHQTDSAGKRLVREVFEVLGWTVNESKDDYGWDFEVEVFTQNNSTGFGFKVQLKSSTATQFSADGSFISEPLTVPSAK